MPHPISINESKKIEPISKTKNKMKKVLFLALCALLVVGCQEEKKEPVAVVPDQSALVDSLQQVIEGRDSEINEIMTTLNQIQEGFRLITEAEGRVTLAKNGEGTDKAAKIKSDIEFIQNKMKTNREMIDKLRAQLNESTIKGNELKQTLENTIASFQRQITEKDRQLSELQAALEAKDIHITQLDQRIDDLHQDVTELQTESSQKSKTISEQDKQLNTAYYVFGTKSELKQQRILEKNEVLRKDFNKNYFTKIDIRTERTIPLYSKSVKVLTSHPASSYRLEADANKNYTLRILDPNQFWSTSKYLVIQVK